MATHARRDVRYSTAIYVYTPPAIGANAPPASTEPQAVQATLSQAVQKLKQEIERRAQNESAPSTSTASPIRSVLVICSS